VGFDLYPLLPGGGALTEVWNLEGLSSYKAALRGLLFSLGSSVYWIWGIGRIPFFGWGTSLNESGMLFGGGLRI